MVCAWEPIDRPRRDAAVDCEALGAWVIATAEALLEAAPTPLDGDAMVEIVVRVCGSEESSS